MDPFRTNFFRLLFHLVFVMLWMVCCWLFGPVGCCPFIRSKNMTPNDVAWQIRIEMIVNSQKMLGSVHQCIAASLHKNVPFHCFNSPSIFCSNFRLFPFHIFSVVVCPGVSCRSFWISGPELRCKFNSSPNDKVVLLCPNNSAPAFLQDDWTTKHLLVHLGGGIWSRSNPTPNTKKTATKFQSHS